MRFDDPSLLAAICAHPQDDSLRLVYADWLDDHDESDRAEFVRLQVANPIETTPRWSLDPTCCHGFVLDPASVRRKDPSLARQLTLYGSRVRKWNGVIHRRLRHGPLYRRIDSRRGLVRGWSYRRGFPCTVWAQVDAVAAHPADVFAIGPIERLNLVGSTRPADLVRMLDGLKESPLRILDFTKAGLTVAGRNLLARRARFTCLDRLERLVGV